MDHDAQQNFDMMRPAAGRWPAPRSSRLYFPAQDRCPAAAGHGPAEALLRWQHPARGMVMPGPVIPLAERSRPDRRRWATGSSRRPVKPGARTRRDKGLRVRGGDQRLGLPDAPGSDIVRPRVADARSERHHIQPSQLLTLRDHAGPPRCWRTPRARRKKPSAAFGELGRCHLSIDDFGCGDLASPRLPAQAAGPRS